MAQWLVVNLNQGPEMKRSLGAWMHAITSLTLLSPLWFCGSPKKLNISWGGRYKRIKLNKALLFPRKFPCSLKAF
jgi:hypothetical protein